MTVRERLILSICAKLHRRIEEHRDYQWNRLYEIAMTMTWKEVKAIRALIREVECAIRSSNERPGDTAR